MIQTILFQILMAPFALLYGLGVLLRNLLYRIGMIKSVQFNFPVISVGNLSMGGSGKTPHIEYLVRMLLEYLDVATLSRGYKRKSYGFLMIQPEMSAEDAGDEPLQLKRKFPELTVAVSESRAFGIPQILQRAPQTKAILLDDAFQHLAVKPGLNIMLTTYSHPFTRDFLLPAGRLREWRRAYRRADLIIVSKCPPDLTEAQRDALLREIKPLPHQRVFFSYYVYREPYYIFNPSYRAALDAETDVLLLSGIANPEYLQEYVAGKAGSVTHIEYEDHHFFDEGEMINLKYRFDNLESGRKMILTTEKDAMRLDLFRQYLQEQQLPVFVLPLEVRFLFGEGDKFDQLIKDYLLNFTV